MRTLSKLALAGVLAAGLAGVATAAARPVHVMSVPLPDGTVARVRYAGDVAPRVTVVPVVPANPWVPVALPGGVDPAGFGMPDLGAMFDQMDRQMTAAMQQVDELAHQPLATAPGAASMASFGGVPAGSTSFSSVTVSQNGHQCSRSTEVVGQGPGKPPRVTSQSSGDCGPSPQQAVPQGTGAPAAAPVPTGPVHQS
ncbi:hypothetical protein [Sphingomonas sp.]|uniref:hypothetical protein n=1 Tax=Sphingomonas sp. TaxID=28214 RepID=UPI0025D2B5F2|nr:hypothetical protein [Sphingomonas sp.]MBV9527362.1 hypothetical protein [Sphingomonas sp.]